MNNNLSIQALVYKDKDQLLDMIQEAIDFARDAGEEELYQAVEQIRAVSYVLENCEYEGSRE